MTERTGRCLCGSVSFKLAREPLGARICWCRDCQHLAANGTVNVVAEADALEVSGPLSEHVKQADSGNQIARLFCPTCGTHLFGRSSARPEIRIIRAGNLDDPSSIKPSMNIWTSRAPSWSCLDPRLQQFPQQPPAPPKP